MTNRLIAVIAVAVLTAVPALLQGRYANRWGEPANLAVAGQRLHEFPRQVGDWSSAEDERPLSDDVCRELGLVSHFHRAYVHAESGDRVDVLLMVGPSGRLVRHPPEVCYANRANQRVGQAVPLKIDGTSPAHEFKLLQFRRAAGPEEDSFCVAYGYATEAGVWDSPSSPRMAFGAEPVLYKLQVLSDVSEQGDQTQLREFVSQFVAAFPGVIASDEPVEATGAE